MKTPLPVVPEPPKERGMDKLHPAFRAKLEALLATLLRVGVPFKVDETLRTSERQVWLYASGRTRPGKVLTQKDGVLTKSRHQLGLAADLYPLTPDGKVYIPPADSAAWDRLATAARSLGLRAGREWHDSPHVEWPGAPRESAAQREEF